MYSDSRIRTCVLLPPARSFCRVDFQPRLFVLWGLAEHLQVDLVALEDALDEDVRTFGVVEAQRVPAERRD